jgi:hypothetical protein
MCSSVVEEEEEKEKEEEATVGGEVRAIRVFVKVGRCGSAYQFGLDSGEVKKLFLQSNDSQVVLGQRRRECENRWATVV